MYGKRLRSKAGATIIASDLIKLYSCYYGFPRTTGLGAKRTEAAERVVGELTKRDRHLVAFSAAGPE